MRRYTIPELLENLGWLKKEYPKYLFRSDVFGIQISAVPTKDIKRHYRPQDKLRQLLIEGPADPLEETALQLVRLLAEKSKVPLSSFGITGSILTGIHNPRFSDIDAVVYGRRNTLEVKRAVGSIYEEEAGRLKRLTGSELLKWCTDKVKSYPVSIEEANHFYRRKWNYGLFGEKLFSVHAAKEDEEIVERYGDEVCVPLGLARIEATVAAISEPVFLPHVCLVEDVVVKEGVGVGEVSQVATQEGFYAGVARKGERVQAVGKVERVMREDTGDVYYRLFVGSPEAGGRDFLKPLRFAVKF